MLLNPCVVDTQELVGSCHHVDVIMLTLAAFFVKILEYSIMRGRVFEQAVHDLKKRLSELGRTSFGNAGTLCFKGAGLERRCVDTGKSNQRLLTVETSHIANFSHELRS